MAVTRKLTVAGMVGTFWLQFENISNQDIHIEARCGSAIRIARSQDGRTYAITSDVPHFRVYVNMTMPNDLPTIFYRARASAYGWFVVEGYQQKDFPQGLLSDSQDIETIATRFAEDPKREVGRD